MSERKIGEGVKVVSVKAKSKGVTLVLSNSEKIVLSPDSFTEFHLYEGKELSVNEISKILAYAGEDEAYTLAIRRLSRDSYTSAQIREKLLAKGFAQGVVDHVISRLTKSGMLDDVHYARTFAEDVGDLRLIGKNRILYELRVKGIGQDIIATLQFPEQKELDKALHYARTLDRRYYRTPQKRRILKIDHALLSRGFDEEIAHQAAKECASAPDEETERFELQKAYDMAVAKYSRKYQGYELKRHVLAYLVRKGFPYDEAKAITEENE